MKSQLIEDLVKRIKLQFDGIGVIFLTVQVVEKALLLHLAKIENISSEGAKEFISNNHFEFIIGKFHKLTNKRFGKEFNKNFEELRELRNFLVHDSVFSFLDQSKEFSKTSEDINGVFRKFVSIADTVLALMQEYTQDITLSDFKMDNDFIYKDIFQKISVFLKKS